MTATESGAEIEYPSDDLTRVSTVLKIDAAATTPGKKRTTPLGLFREMPFTVKLTVVADPPYGVVATDVKLCTSSSVHATLSVYVSAPGLATSLAGSS